MTLATRQTLAAAAISSIVAFFSRKHSFSASIATSVPILLRNLKQSATVFAGVYTFSVPPRTGYSLTPKLSAAPDILISRIVGEVIFGLQAFTPMAIQTSWGD